MHKKHRWKGTFRAPKTLFPVVVLTKPTSKKSPKWPFALTLINIEVLTSSLQTGTTKTSKYQPNSRLHMVDIVWLPLLLSDFKKLSLQLWSQYAHESEAILQTSNNRMFACNIQINHKPFHCLGSPHQAQTSWSDVQPAEDLCSKLWRTTIRHVQPIH
jgi:hypothetical protein